MRKLPDNNSAATSPTLARLERQIAMLSERVNSLCLQQEVGSRVKSGLTIDEAAERLGMSKSQFRRVFIDGGRLYVYSMGERARVIDVKELDDAWERYKSDIRRLSARAAMESPRPD